MARFASISGRSANAIHVRDDKSAEDSEGIGIVSFLSAVGTALAIFAAQALIFLLLRNKLARILYVTAPLVAQLGVLTRSLVSQRHTSSPSGSAPKHLPGPWLACLRV